MATSDIRSQLETKLETNEETLFEEIGAAFIEVPFGAAPPKKKDYIIAGIDAVRSAKIHAQKYICASNTIRTLATSHRVSTAIDLAAAIYDCLTPYEIDIFGKPVPLLSVSVLLARMSVIEFCANQWYSQ